MNRILKALAVAALITVAGNVIAQVVQQDGSRTDPGRRGTGQAILTGGIYRSDTTMRVNTVDGSGNLYVREAYPPTASNTSQQLIADFSIASAAGCSSNVVNVAGLRHMKLLLKATPTSGVAGNLASLAVQVRTHLNGSADSASTFAEYPLATFITMNSATATDTLNLGHHSTGSATLPWSGEFVVRAAANRNAPGNAVAAVVWSYPNGIAIPLDSVFGRDFWGDYISVRVRNLGPLTCIINAYLIGTPL